MRLTGEKGIGNILKIFLQICFYGGILTLIVIPFAFKFSGITLHASLIFGYPIGIVLLIIVHKFIQLFDSLKNNNPFCKRNIKILKHTSITALVGSIIWLVALFYEIFLVKTNDIIFILILVFLCILFFGVAIALYILSELFKQAYEYKEENELTI